MSRFRCFDSNRKVSLTQYSSNRTENLRNKTVYSDLVKHKDNKKDGTTHKTPFILGGCDNNQKYLRYAPSHQDLLNVTKGAFINNPICTLSGCSIDPGCGKCPYDILDGVFLTTPYDHPDKLLVLPTLEPSGDTSWNTVTQTTILSSDYPGVWVDPSNIWFTPSCPSGNNNFLQNTTISGETRKDFTYLQRAKTDTLHGFSYPRCLKMSISGCC